MRSGYSWFAWLRLHRHLPHKTLNLFNSREKKNENLTCNNPAGDDAISTAWGGWLMLLISLLLQSCGLTLSGTLFNDENVILKNEAGTYPNTEGNYDEK